MFFLVLFTCSGRWPNLIGENRLFAPILHAYWTLVGSVLTLECRYADFTHDPVGWFIQSLDRVFSTCRDVHVVNNKRMIRPWDIWQLSSCQVSEFSVRQKQFNALRSLHSLYYREIYDNSFSIRQSLINTSLFGRHIDWTLYESVTCGQIGGKIPSPGCRK